MTDHNPTPDPQTVPVVLAPKMRPLANRAGQDLALHCVLVGRLAGRLIKSSYSVSSEEDDPREIELMIRDGLFTGLLHDIGKTDPPFRAYMASVSLQLNGTDPTTDTIDTIETIDTEGAISATDGEHMESAPENSQFSFETYPRHEEVSWLLMNLFISKPALRKLLSENQSALGAEAFSHGSTIEYAVYWHHAKPLRSHGAQEENFGDASKLAQRINAQSDWLQNGAHQDVAEFLERVEQYEPLGLKALMVPAGDVHLAPIATPAFNHFFADSSTPKGSEIKAIRAKVVAEARRTAVRSAVVSADRIVSSLSARQLEAHVLGNTLPEWGAGDQATQDLLITHRQIHRMAARFEEKYPGQRTAEQVQAASQAQKIATSNRIAVLQGPAGCGKSKIFLHFVALFSQVNLISPRRIFIFVPRTAIGESLFREMGADYGITHGVELLTGQTKLLSQGDLPPIETPEHLQGTGNIVITTIDQLGRTMLSHKSIDLVTELAGCHVIFDEFHELFEIPAISLMFMQMLVLRKMSSASTLLVSATPNPYFLDKLGLDKWSIVKVPTFNKNTITLKLHRWDASVYASGKKKTGHPFVDPTFKPAAGAFVVSNFATTAQNAAISRLTVGHPAICFHSKFTPHDKSALLEEIINAFGRNALRADAVVYSGPILQASLNISTHEMHTEGCHFENLLQRLGRVDRFGALSSAVAHVYWALNAAGNDLANAQDLTRMSQRGRTKATFDFLKNKLQGLTSRGVTIAEVYDWYDEFHALPAIKAAYDEDFTKVLIDSVAVFKSNDFAPVQWPARITAKKGQPAGKLAAASLRGRSYFVLPLLVKIANTGAQAVRSLLWDAHSPRGQCMTDELRAASFSDSVAENYRQLTTGANKPSTILAADAGAQGREFLKAIAKRSRGAKKWTQIKHMALDRQSPIVVSTSKQDADSLIYLDYQGVKIGLVSVGILPPSIGQSLKNP